MRVRSIALAPALALAAGAGCAARDQHESAALHDVAGQYRMAAAADRSIAIDTDGDGRVDSVFRWDGTMDRFQVAVDTDRDGFLDLIWTTDTHRGSDQFGDPQRIHEAVSTPAGAGR